VKAFILSKDSLKLIEEESLQVTYAASKFVIAGSWSSVEKFRKHLKHQQVMDKSFSQTLGSDSKQAVIHHSNDVLSIKQPQSTKSVLENSSDGIMAASDLDHNDSATVKKMGAYQNSSLSYDLQQTTVIDNIANKDKEDHITTNHKLVMSSRQEEHAVSVGDVHPTSPAIEYKITFNCVDERKPETLSTSANDYTSMKFEFIDLPKISRRVTIKLADIVNEDVDAIVNPANAQLMHQTGVAAAIDIASNGEVQKASTQLISQIGMLATGNAVVTGVGGTLKCKMIIHAVAPTEFKNYSSLLMNACNNAMTMVERFGHKSVSFPPIGSDELTADVMLSTLCTYKSHNPSLLTDVRIVINDLPTYQVFHNALQKERQRLETLLDDSPFYSATVTAATSSVTAESNCPLYYPGVLVHIPPPGITQRWDDNEQFRVPVNHQVIRQQPTKPSYPLPAIPAAKILPGTSTFSYTPLLHNPQNYVHSPPMLTTTQNAINTSLATSVTSSLPVMFNNIPLSGRSGSIDGCKEIGEREAVLPTNNHTPDSPNAKKFKGDSESLCVHSDVLINPFELGLTTNFV